MNGTQLANAGISIFPLTANRTPKAGSNGFKSASPIPSNTDFTGIAVPVGVTIIDLDTYKSPALTTTAIDTLFGHALNWQAAHLQSTLHGGQHYAFALPPEATIHQTTNWFTDILGEGFDTRTTGKGYIATGPGYTPSPDGLGLLKLATPSMLPVLPPMAVMMLTKPSAPSPEASSILTPDQPPTIYCHDDIVEMLTFIPSTRGYTGWMAVAAALRNHYSSSPEQGLQVFDAWSASATDDSYKGSADASRQYYALSPEPKSADVQPITIGSLVWRARGQGYKPTAAIERLQRSTMTDAPQPFMPPALSTEHVSTDTPDTLVGTAQSFRDSVDDYMAQTNDYTEALDTLIEMVNSLGGNPSAMSKLQRTIRDTELEDADRHVLSALLYARGKDVGITVSKSAIIAAIMPVHGNTQSLGGLTFPDITTTGKPKMTVENVEQLLNHYGIVVRYNRMTKQIEFSGNVIPDVSENSYYTEIISKANRHDIQLTNGIPRKLDAIAEKNQYHPVQDWLVANKPWAGGHSLIAQLADCIPTANPQFNRIMIMRWMIGAVAAVMNERGVKSSGLIVLQGGQGIGKTSWFRSLLPDPTWGLDGVAVNPENKDSIMTVLMYWMCELGELDATFRQSAISSLKSFITTDTDNYRAPYDRRAIQHPRRTVFMATVNSRNFLHDPTGNRRFWTIPCLGEINFNHGIDLSQLWAEAYAYYLAGEQCYLTDAESSNLNSVNTAHTDQDPMIDNFTKFYSVTPDPGTTQQMLTSSAILKMLGYDKPTQQDSRRLQTALSQRFKLEPRMLAGTPVFDVYYREPTLPLP